MNHKAIDTLELNKILARLAEHADFAASRELINNLRPTSDLEMVLERQGETTEARILLDERPTLTIGGARDIRAPVYEADRGKMLAPETLLEIRSTLEASAALKSTIERTGERFPRLLDIAHDLYEGWHITSAIARAIDDYGQVLDSASQALGSIRHKLRGAHERLNAKLQSIVSNSRNAPYLQEALITVRGGRYVIPVKSEAKGRLPGIVHDQSASGATLFIEPLATVDINNEIRELELAETDEIERILREITRMVAAESGALITCVEALARLDSAFARARYAYATNASAPLLHPFDPAATPGSIVRLNRARHPLLDPDTVIPLDLELSGDTFLMVITGPNTGGKTVTLKTVGLMAMMAQCGLHIPAADGSELTVFEDIFADIGDEQSIEQSLSTFSGHLTNIISILENANDRSLVLIDELGSGTDPVEGAAIARAILDNFTARGITTLVATHYPELKMYAHSTAGVRNASMEFDLQTLSPTYRLLIGLPGRSNALAIATRLGLPGEIIEDARSYVGEDDMHVDDLLDEIRRTREELSERQQLMDAAEREVMRLRADLDMRITEIDRDREAIVEETQREALDELEALQEELREVRKQVSMLSPTIRAGIDEVLTQYDETSVQAGKVAEKVRKSAGRRPAPRPRPSTAREASTPAAGPLAAGDRVYVPGLNSDGEVMSLDGDEAEVQVGQLRVRVEAATLELKSRAADRAPARESRDGGGVSMPRAESPGTEIHIRGMTVEEAIPVVEGYIDQAYLASLPWVRIVHGKGTGALRSAVRDLVRHHPLVKEFKSAPREEGGDGATLVYF